ARVWKSIGRAGYTERGERNPVYVFGAIAGRYGRRFVRPSPQIAAAGGVYVPTDDHRIVYMVFKQRGYYQRAVPLDSIFLGDRLRLLGDICDHLIGTVWVHLPRLGTDHAPP